MPLKVPIPRREEWTSSKRTGQLSLVLARSARCYRRSRYFFTFLWKTIIEFYRRSRLCWAEATCNPNASWYSVWKEAKTWRGRLLVLLGWRTCSKAYGSFSWKSLVSRKCQIWGTIFFHTFWDRSSVMLRWPVVGWIRNMFSFCPFNIIKVRVLYILGHFLVRNSFDFFLENGNR